MSNKPKKQVQTLTNWTLDLMNSHDLDFKGLLDKLPSLRPDIEEAFGEPLPRDPSDEELEWEAFKSEVGGYSATEGPVETSDGEIDAVVDENGKIHWK